MQAHCCNCGQCRRQCARAVGESQKVVCLPRRAVAIGSRDADEAQGCRTTQTTPPATLPKMPPSGVVTIGKAILGAEKLLGRRS